MTPRIRVLHIITDLGQGGAEAVLHRLIVVTRDRFEHAVVSLHQDGVYGQPLRDCGVSVTSLGIKRGTMSIVGLRRLHRAIVAFAPDVIQTRLDHANLVGGLVSRFTGAPPIIWAVHSTDLGPLRSSWRTRIVRRVCALCSYFIPNSIVSDAGSSADLHKRIGFRSGNFVVVPNGVDSEQFRPDAGARQRAREGWGATATETLIGCVARWDPLKDHENLIGAVKMLVDRGIAFRCVLIGRGLDAGNQHLQAMIEKWGVSDRIVLAGATSDVAAAMNGLDLHVLPSRSESLPVAVMEAMACGTPCVVTDVGDARKITGENGWIAKPRDSLALSEAIAEALKDFARAAFASRKEACRARIIREFSLDRMGVEYSTLWLEAIRKH